MLSKRRDGLSLAEVVAVVAILSLVVAAIAGVASHHQRRFASLAAGGAARAQVREGAAILSAALRDVSPAAGDLYGPELSATVVAFRFTSGTFLACAPAVPGEARLHVVPAEDAPSALAQASSVGVTVNLPDGWGPPPAGAQGATEPRQPPSPGDSLLIYDVGPRLDGGDDRWVGLAVTGVSGSPACAGRTVRASYIVELSAPPPASIPVHAPVRAFRRTRYGLYLSADGSWQLGASDCVPTRASPCAPWQPVSGPYRPPASTPGGEGGLALFYLDHTGTETRDPVRVARIDAVLRAPASSVPLASTSTGTIKWTIPLRNGRL